MKRLHRRSALALSLVTLALSATLIAAPAANAATSKVTSKAVKAAAQADHPNWVRDYSDDFSGPLNDKAWGRYGYGYQPVNNGAMGVYKPENVYTHDGVMALRTQYQNGQWSSAGVSGNPGFSAVGGKWEVRAKMPYAKGIGYVFLLMPTDGSWPPELNLAEGRVNGRVEHFYHWGTADNQQRAMAVSYPNTHEWHTYGAYPQGNQIIYTIDGDTVSAVLNDVDVTNKPLWLGMQTGAMDPNGDAKDYETIDGGVPNSSTPASSEIQIDWVAHYHS